MRRFSVFLGLVLCSLAGCEGPASVAQSVVGEWTGRPEKAAERLVREWPVTGAGTVEMVADPDDPEIAAAIAEEPPTDLELALKSINVSLQLQEDGQVLMSSDGQPSIEGKWHVTPLAGRRATLDIEATTDGGEPVRRRYDLELLRTGEGFTLRESGADRQFGRLIFTRSGAG